ncbi:hypothetical protein [Clostridium tagluense]|nr:hypothetical protein [Clostridium tagluense]MBW9157944.1 hypothetical protein [Clostridium tagluense]WLC66192.1 hypothetical protein KTC93_02875 [Clostridium tagluense]
MLKKLSECIVLIVDDTEENVDILVEVLGMIMKFQLLWMENLRWNM